jgi:hypothetical protein
MPISEYTVTNDPYLAKCGIVGSLSASLNPHLTITLKYAPYLAQCARSGSLIAID